MPRLRAPPGERVGSGDETIIPGHARCILSNMFILAEMCDVVRIEPRRFAHDTDQEITDELNKKFANKVGFP